jgi:hypothetical protein
MVDGILSADPEALKGETSSRYRRPRERSDRTHWNYRCFGISAHAHGIVASL